MGDATLSLSLDYFESSWGGGPLPHFPFHARARHWSGWYVSGSMASIPTTSGGRQVPWQGPCNRRASITCQASAQASTWQVALAGPYCW